VSASVNVPTPIRDEIDALGLPDGLVDRVYERLAADLESGHRGTLPRLAGPAAAFVYALALTDPTAEGRRHLFTFFLEEEDKQGLVVLQVHHARRDG
jgi:hypothetical protein